jgi:hypothetical protein
MDQQPMQDRRILEAMDACRPGSDDVGDPGLAPLAAELAANAEFEELFTRLQKLDATLAGAIQDVPPPAGLADRLLVRLATSEAVEGRVSADMAAVAAVGGTVAPASRRLRNHYFRWVVAASVLAAVAVPALVAVLQWRAAHQFTPQSVVSEGLGFYVSETRGPAQFVDDVAPPSALPLSRAVLPLRGVRWRAIQGFLDRAGLAYDLAGPGGAQATLYVVRRTVAGAPAAPPVCPFLATGNCSTSTWQEAGLLYVLVVRGDASAYAGFLDLPRGPLT